MKILRSRVHRLAALALLLPVLVLAQSKPAVQLGPMGDVGQANLPGQKIGSNDLVAISVYDSPELTRTVRVSADGYIRLPMLKDRLKVDGLLPGELEAVIAIALKEGGILIDPIVAVTVAEYHSRPISVVGAVKKPTTFQAVGNVTLLEAIGRAEGLTIEAGPEILLSRPDPDNPLVRQLVQRIAVRDLIDLAKPELNIPLTGGEEIRIPEARKIYVTGNVKRPGAFLVREGSPMTVLKALAMSEGLTSYYMKQAYILRPDDSGNKKEIQVELAKILKREADDVLLLPDDILYVPENTRRKTTMTIAEKASGFALGTVSGVLVWRR